MIYTTKNSFQPPAIPFKLIYWGIVAAVVVVACVVDYLLAR